MSEFALSKRALGTAAFVCQNFLNTVVKYAIELLCAYKFFFAKSTVAKDLSKITIELNVCGIIVLKYTKFVFLMNFKFSHKPS